MKPLNGNKTHPLSTIATAALDSLKSGPRPAQEFNPGVVNRLLREGCELVYLPTPYRTRTGNIAHLRLRLAHEHPPASADESQRDATPSEAGAKQEGGRG